MCFSRSRRKYRSGYTLIELMAVIVVISLIAGVLVVGIRGYVARAKRDTTKQRIGQIDAAIQLYVADHSSPPTSDEGLDALKAKSDDMIDGYYQGSLTDPWGNRFEYFVPGMDGEPYEIVSLGSDGKEGGKGTAADISSIELKSDADE